MQCNAIYSQLCLPAQKLTRCVLIIKSKCTHNHKLDKERTFLEVSDEGLGDGLSDGYIQRTQNRNKTVVELMTCFVSDTSPLHYIASVGVHETAAIAYGK